MDTERSRALELMLERSVGMGPDGLGELLGVCADVAGLAGATLYVVDHEQLGLHPAPPGVPEDAIAIDGTVAGRAFMTGQAQVGERSGQLWVPLLDGSDRLGVMGFSAPDFDEALMSAAELLTRAVSQLLVAKNNYTDVYKKARRTRPMTVGADLVWSLLPPQSFVSEKVAVAAILAPAYDLGGDAYDYSVNDGMADLAIFDAMGHGTPASLLATLTLATYRHARRLDLDLASIGENLDGALASVFPDHFVTGHLARLDLERGDLQLINAGHHLPMLVRDGRVIDGPDVVPRVPFGLGPDGVAVTIVGLQPGDRVLFFTDGVIEAHVKGGRAFGRGRLGELLGHEAAAGLSASETLRRLSHAVLSHLGDSLKDDATLVMVEWMPV